MVGADRPQGAPAAARAGWRAALVVGCVLLGEALGGAAVWLLTDGLSKTDIGMGGLTLRGNGALIVPVLGMPALLVLGGALLVRVGRSRRRWLLAGLIAAPLALCGGCLMTGRAAPAWISAQSPGRSGHTATLLPDGRALLTGGTGSLPGLSPAVVRASAEVHDPATGAWAPTGRMGVPRVGHTAVLLGTGQVLVLGGTSPETEQWAEVYDPATGSWIVATGPGRKPAELNSRATLLSDGTVLLVGTLFDPVPAVVAERYDPVARAWAPTGSPTSIRWFNSGADPALLPDGRVLLVGPVAPGFGEVAAELYNPSTGTWSATGRPPVEWPVPILVPLADARVLALGGAGHGGFASAALYDATTGTWSATAAPAAGRYDYAATRLGDGRVLAAGGNMLAQTPSGLLGVPTASAEVYEPTSGTWSGAGSMQTGRVGHTLTLLPSGAVLAAGGSTRAGPLASAEIYDPITDTWAPMGRMDAR
jgi:large repetitive protein